MHDVTPSHYTMHDVTPSHRYTYIQSPTHPPGDLDVSWFGLGCDYSVTDQEIYEDETAVGFEVACVECVDKLRNGEELESSVMQLLR